MISKDRIQHILHVANLMKEKAESLGLDKEEMFTLGLLHDIGYEYTNNDEHRIIGFKILEKQNYKYAKEVLYHGKPNSEYSSKALDLLNYADMHIDNKGNYVSFEQRLEDIKNRRGVSSQAFTNSKLIIIELQNKNF